MTTRSSSRPSRCGAVVCVLSLLLALSACGDESSSTEGSLCPLLPGASFFNERHESTIDEGVEQEVSLSEELDFSEDEVGWWSGDTVDTGAWTCSDNDVTWLDGRFRGELQNESGLLVLTTAGDRWIGPQIDTTEGRSTIPS
ncbi:MAG: hypothetical protein AAGA42_01695 [Actinomycetota bacterium]